jgi:hypothetical protein
VTKVGIAAALLGGSGRFLLYICIASQTGAVWDVCRLGFDWPILIDCRFHTVEARRIEAIDRLLDERTTLPNPLIDLLGQDLEALVAELTGFSLLLLRHGRHHREVISRMQRDRLSDCP